MSTFTKTPLFTKQETKHELLPAGNYIARCYSIVDLGTQEDNFKGDVKNLRKIRITWELPTEMRVFNEENGEQPLVKGRKYTLSMYEKSNLRQMLEGWRGKRFTDDEINTFDEKTILGKPCMLNIVHRTNANDQTYAVIAGVTQIPKGMQCPEQINPSFSFCLDDFDEELWEKIPAFIKEEILKSPEMKKIRGEFEEKDDTDDLMKKAKDNAGINYQSDIKAEDLPF